MKRDVRKKLGYSNLPIKLMLKTLKYICKRLFTFTIKLIIIIQKKIKFRLYYVYIKGRLEKKIIAKKVKKIF